MHIPAISYIALSVLTVVKAQTLSIAAQPSQAANANNFFCGNWAGSPRAQDVPAEQLLPAADYIKRFFVEPQLTDPPYRPLMASEPRVQIPKLWGNNNFRLALLSYSQDKPAKRLYSSSKSRWVDFHQALEGLMTECVSKGSGGAYLVPPSPGLTQSTLVLYAYETGSEFDYTMNYYMTAPYGINPANFQPDAATASNLTVLDS